MSALWRRDTDVVGTSGGARTTQTYILGVGASGALLAGAGVALISLVGLVSFDVWPGTPAGVGSQEEAQLNFGGSAQPAGEGPLGEAPGLIVATPEGTAGTPAPGGANGGTEKKQPASKPDEPAAPPPAGDAPTAPVAPAVPAPVEAGSRTDNSTVKNPLPPPEDSPSSDTGTRPPKRTPPGQSKGSRPKSQSGSSGSNGSSGGGSRGSRRKPPRTSTQPVPSAPAKTTPGSSGRDSGSSPGNSG